MSVENAYQQVIAGRVREDEQIAFLGKNKIAVPGRVINFNSTGGKQQPVLEKDFLHTTSVGKAGNTTPELNAYADNAYNKG